MAGKRVVIVGAGAVGGYIGAHMTRGGHDVTMVDPWPAHVEIMRTRGLEISGMTPAEAFTQKMKAHPPHRAAGRHQAEPIDIAIISVKSYDTHLGDAHDPALPGARRLRRLGPELRQRGAHGRRRRLGQGGRMHGRQQLRRRPLRGRQDPPHHAEDRPGRLPRSRRGAWPHHAAHRRTRRHASVRGQGQDHDQSLGRALVEALRQRHAQWRLGRDRPRRQRARRPRPHSPRRDQARRRVGARRSRVGLRARKDRRRRARPLRESRRQRAGSPRRSSKPS